MSDDALTVPARPAGKAKRSTLYGPLALLALLVIGWSGYWVYMSQKIKAVIEQQRATLTQAGYKINSDLYEVNGYPFRFFLEFRNLSVIAPSGRGVAAPDVQVEADAYALDKWVLLAPGGLTLYRGHPGGVDFGRVSVSGSLLRASLSGLRQPVHTIDLQGRDLVVTPSDPNHPFAFTTAKSFQAHLRPTTGVSDSADLMMNVTGAHGVANSFSGDVSPDKPLSFQVEGALDHAMTFKSGDLAQGFAAWQAAGGQISRFRAKLVQGELGADSSVVFSQDCEAPPIAADDLNLCASSDALSINPESRLQGHIAVQLAGTFKPVEVLGAVGLISKDNMTLAQPLLDMTLATKGTQKLGLDFRNGSAYVGPLKVSDAPILR